MNRRAGTMERTALWVIGTRTEVERQELSGGNQHYLLDKPGRREFLPGTGRLENHTSWARFQRLVSANHITYASAISHHDIHQNTKPSGINRRTNV